MMDSMAKPGPKPKPPAEVRHKQVNFVARPDEIEAYKHTATQAEKTLSDWIRDTLNRAAGRAKKKNNQQG